MFTPHGVPPSGLLPYLTQLSPPQKAPIIDLVLHPFTLTTAPLHLGGEITLGIPNITELLKSGVGVRIVASAHDEKKGYVRSRIKTRRWGREEANGEIWGAMLSETEGSGMVDREMLPEGLLTPRMAAEQAWKNAWRDLEQ
ncbi:hypothetical protein BGX38DRAFT_1265047 [Terfezia claveryi]|nr:hypothetical protein BGX38DRAFT_1265047 [Terfezia claveryi]